MMFPRRNSRSRETTRRCLKWGHVWANKTWGVVGDQHCLRRKCKAERLNPLAIPPWTNRKEDYHEFYPE